MPVGRRESGEQLDAGGDQLVIFGDQAADLDVVLIGADVEMALHRVGLTAGHRARVHRSRDGAAEPNHN